MKIEEIWPKLEEQSWDGAYVQRVIFPEAHIDLFAALQQPSKMRMLLFATDKGIVNGQRSITSSTGLTVRRYQSDDYGKDKIVTQILLTDKRFEELFTVLLQDVCDRVLACPGPEAAYITVVERIAEWQRFLSKQPPEGLTEEQQRGLFGELLFLKALMASGVVQESGLRCWRGPRGADQDFQFPKTAVEVKVSLAAQNQEIVISNERQLDTRSLDNFFIYHVSVITRHRTGETLPELVEAMRSSVASQFKRDLDDGLFAAGYLDLHADRYTETGGYVIRESNYFTVKEQFPRITELDLLPGVGRVSYAISVPACKKFSTTETAVMEAIRAAYGG